MPAQQSDGSDAAPESAPTEPAESTEPAEPETEHLSRAERRAARSGRAVPVAQPPWSTGKVTGGRPSAPSRKQYSNRRSGG